MKSLVKWFNSDAPAGWTDIVVRALKVGIITFIVRQLQDWFEGGTFDTGPNAMDALWIGCGVLIIYAIHLLLKKP